MFALINRLRQKSEAQRRSIALWTALALTLCVFVLWFVSFIVRLDANTETGLGAESEVSPVQSLAEITASFFSVLKERF